eukprot:4913457-Alexandrium_andersonii.AAC.1
MLRALAIAAVLVTGSISCEIHASCFAVSKGPAAFSCCSAARRGRCVDQCFGLLAREHWRRRSGSRAVFSTA